MPMPRWLLLLLPLRLAEPRIISEGRDLDSGEQTLLRVAVGSCNNARKQSLWSVISAVSPQALVLLGDNVYADRRDGLNKYLPATPEDIQQQYALLDADPDFQDLVRRIGGFEHVYAVSACENVPWIQSLTILS